LNKGEHPVRIQSAGGYYKYTDCSQETPNTQASVLEYADGTILQFETRGLDTNGEGQLGVKIGNIFYGTEGWMEVNGSKWQVYKGRKGEPGPGSEGEASNNSTLGYLAAPGGGGHYANFIAAVRSGNKADLTCDIYEGFLSSALPHLANVSYRLGGTLLDFDPVNERFINNEGANDMLTREYREPYVVPDHV
jgi:hypothetical protein